MDSPRAVRLLLRAEFSALLRSPQGILGACFMFGAAGWALSKLAGNAELVNRLASGGLDPEESVLLAVVKWLAGGDADYLTRLLVERSPFISIFFVVTAFAIPFSAMITSLDQNATDIGNRGIRFYLVRVRRGQLFWGRFLGNVLFVGSTCLAVAVAGTIFALVLDAHHDALEIMTTGVWAFGALWLAAIPWIALMALCGNLTGNPLLAATLGFGTYLGIALIGGFGGWLVEGLKALRYLLPAPLRYQLLTGDLGGILLAAAATLGYATVFAWAGWFSLRRRDL
ncbi:MAG: hypothetical protein GYA21_00985 [Myxococcales bacterium]|nr:hypothetical protein [Myxococcales bacterium]